MDTDDDNDGIPDDGEYFKFDLYLLVVVQIFSKLSFFCTRKQNYFSPARIFLAAFPLKILILRGHFRKTASLLLRCEITHNNTPTLA